MGNRIKKIFIGTLLLTRAACEPVAHYPWERDCSAVGRGAAILRHAPDPMVQNGDAYDCSIVRYDATQRLRVPAGAQISRTAPAGELRLHTRKSLDFLGYPQRPMNPEVARRNMGCAYQTRGETLTLGLFGEWQGKEGGARTALFLNIPPGLAVEPSAELSGEGSEAQDLQGAPETSPGFWYVSGRPATGWVRIDSVPEDAWFFSVPPG